MNREYHKWWSDRLGRDMELLVFGHAGAKVLIFPTRGGRFHEYEDMRVVASLRDKIEQGHLQLYCVDSVDAESLYCCWAHPHGRIERQKAYEEYILNEVMPFMQDKNQHECVISHGCSLGAFHAANIAFRHPHLFKKLVAFSGRYDLTLNVEYFSDLFSGYYNDDIYYHTPTHFLPNLHCDWRLQQLRAMEIVLVIGRDDPFKANNEHLSHILWGKGIAHQLLTWDERAHRAYYWRRMAPLYL
ncbi:esterase family protein [Corallincola spongiicola]|uniref:Esterase n=1 Tax=Corallincola spongiicola TaxID=2520508 RepID=A0ABY1WTA8_9GAMM|nr:alpha/beta hydrolase-fold protein [Corallincola spongiicola]TAA47969.1 esterase [Corallincola spongiicola]